MPHETILDALEKICYESGLSTQRHNIPSVKKANGKTGRRDLLIKDASIGGDRNLIINVEHMTFHTASAWETREKAVASRERAGRAPLIEELTVPLLVGMARMSFGHLVLDGTLRENNMRLQLLTGERMAIVQAVANIATQTAGADASLDGGITGIPRQHASYEPSHIAGSSFGCRDDARACRMHDLQQIKELFDAGLLDEEVYKDEQRALLAKYCCKVY